MFIGEFYMQSDKILQVKQNTSYYVKYKYT